MLYADGALGLILLGLWLFCIIDVITTDESNIRNLPKLVWLLVVIVLFDLGSLAWLIAGHNWNAAGRPHGIGPGAARSFPEYDRAGRAVPQNPDDDEAFLHDVRLRAETQRRQYRERRRRELDAEHIESTTRPEDDDPRT